MISNICYFMFGYIFSLIIIMIMREINKYKNSNKENK